jgi:hypothetical protein
MKLSELVIELESIRKNLISELDDPTVKIMGLVNGHTVELDISHIEAITITTSKKLENKLSIKVEDQFS